MKCSYDAKKAANAYHAISGYFKSNGIDFDAQIEKVNQRVKHMSASELKEAEKEINAFSSYWKKHDVHRLPKNPEGLPAVPRVKPRLFSKRPLGFRGGAAAVKELPQDFIDEMTKKGVTDKDQLKVRDLQLTKIFENHKENPMKAIPDIKDAIMKSSIEESGKIKIIRIFDDQLTKFKGRIDEEEKERQDAIDQSKDSTIANQSLLQILKGAIITSFILYFTDGGIASNGNHASMGLEGQGLHAAGLLGGASQEPRGPGGPGVGRGIARVLVLWFAPGSITEFLYFSAWMGIIVMCGFSYMDPKGFINIGMTQVTDGSCMGATGKFEFMRTPICNAWLHFLSPMIDGINRIYKGDYTGMHKIVLSLSIGAATPYMADAMLWEICYAVDSRITVTFQAFRGDPIVYPRRTRTAISGKLGWYLDLTNPGRTSATFIGQTVMPPPPEPVDQAFMAQAFNPPIRPGQHYMQSPYQQPFQQAQGFPQVQGYPQGQSFQQAQGFPQVQGYPQAQSFQQGYQPQFQQYPGHFSPPPTPQYPVIQQQYPSQIQFHPQYAAPPPQSYPQPPIPANFNRGFQNQRSVSSRSIRPPPRTRPRYDPANANAPRNEPNVSNLSNSNGSTLKSVRSRGRPASRSVRNGQPPARSRSKSKPRKGSGSGRNSNKNTNSRRKR